MNRVAFLVDGAITALDSPRALRLAHGRRAVRLEMMRHGKREARDFPLDDIADNTEFLAVLRAGDVETMHSLETTLEDVFVRVTGRTPRMTAMLAALLWDIVLQARNGFIGRADFWS